MIYFGDIRRLRQPHPCALTSKGITLTYTCALPRRRVGKLLCQDLSRRPALKVRAMLCKSDTWSDQKRRHYLAITAHWIAEAKGTSSLQLKVALIAFHQLGRSHSGRSIARTVRHLLDRAGVMMKVR